MAGTVKKKQPKRNRKGEILDAAEKLLRERGLSGVTTRAIAEEVPCSEGAIYVHFASRVDLLLAVLERSLPAMLEPLQALEESVGRQTVERNLTDAMEGLQSFHKRTAPMLASLFAEPELLAMFRERLLTKEKGPRGAIGRMERYLKAEEKLGRVALSMPAETVASVLMSASFFANFASQLTGQTLPGLKGKALVRQLLRS